MSKSVDVMAAAMQLFDQLVVDMKKENTYTSATEREYQKRKSELELAKGMLNTLLQK